MKTKVKTKKILAKKVKISGTGKIIRMHQFKTGHLRRHKSASALRRHQQPVSIHKTVRKTMERLLGR